MKEKQCINGKDVWLSVMPFYPVRENPNVIPAEYFTIAYSLKEHGYDSETIKDENGEPKLFESPVAAINYANKKLQENL
jgi:hypothetical protein